MDAFESIVGRLLEQEGYWVKQSVKIHLEKSEKKSIFNKPSMPDIEIDLVAIKGKECILFEVKSFLGSKGVRLSAIENSTKKKGAKYRILNEPKFQETVKSKLKVDFDLPLDVEFLYGLAAGKVIKKDLEGIPAWFAQRPDYVYWSPKLIAAKISELGDKTVYINDPVTLAIKILRQENRLIEGDIKVGHKNASSSKP